MGRPRPLCSGGWGILSMAIICHVECEWHPSRPIMPIDKFLRPSCVGTGLAAVLGEALDGPTRTGARTGPTHDGRFILFIFIIGTYVFFLEGLRGIGRLCWMRETFSLMRTI